MRTMSMECVIDNTFVVRPNHLLVEAYDGELIDYRMLHALAVGHVVARGEPPEAAIHVVVEVNYTPPMTLNCIR